MSESILEISRLCKSFWSVPVLSGIDLSIWRGEVHALVGENGAGKSTLIKIICGAYQSDSGEMVLDGRNYAAASPLEALKSGISVIYQETSLVPTLTVMQNVFLGIEPVSTVLSICRRDAERKLFDDLCSRIGYRLPAHEKVKNIGPAERKLAEIAKALAHEAKLIIMDEPTDSLSGGEIEAFFKVVEDLKSRGMTIIYITHYLSELFRIADRVTVLKDGAKVDTRAIKQTTSEEIVGLMLGRTETDPATRKSEKRQAGAELLRAEKIARGNAVSDVSLTLHKGEIVGLVGVIGSGKTELARILFGADRPDSGSINIKGAPVGRLTPRSAKGHGIGFLPEDRKTLGLLQEQSVKVNLTLTALEKVSRGLVLSRERESEVCGRLIDSLSIKVANLWQRVKFLSGGNQQKVVIGKWLLADPDILILDEPTRGIDIGSKRAIYRLARDIADQGKTILFISSEVPEILEVSDRILVMRKGRIAGEFATGATQDAILGLMLEAEKA